MGTSYKTRIILDGEVKVCKFSKYDGYEAEDKIRYFFTVCDFEDIKEKIRSIETADNKYVKKLADKIEVEYIEEEDLFPSWNEFERFLNTFPEYAHRQSIWDLLRLIETGDIEKLPRHDNIDEKYLSFKIVVNLDTEEITVENSEKKTYTKRLRGCYTRDATTIFDGGKRDGNEVLYMCMACGYDNIQKNFQNCPICGRKIIRIIPPEELQRIKEDIMKGREDKKAEEQQGTGEELA